MDKLKELRGTLEERRKSLAEVFEQAGAEMDMDAVKAIEGDSAAKVDQIRAWNDEIDDLAKQIEELDALGKTRDRVGELGKTNGHPGHPTGDGKRPEPVKSLGELIVESGALKHKKVEHEIDLDPKTMLKTLFETATGWVPETTRTPRVIDFATRPIQVTDVVPSGTTSQQSVVFMEETTFTNAAVEIAEGVAKPEATLALTEKTSPVRKIAVFLPVTDEQLEDVPQVRGYIDNRLRFMVQQRLDSQILVGTGIAPNLTGFLNVAGIQTQAKGTDPTPDAVHKAMTKVRVTGRAVPGAAIFHPNDWQDIRLLRTADGIYIWGSPSEAGPERIWGLPVVQADGITEGTALVGDFANFSELAIRRGVSVEVSNSHASFFIENKQAIRAEMRAALVVYRPTAFATVTGI